MQAVLTKISPRELRMLLGGLFAVVVAALTVSLLVPQVKRLLAARQEVALLASAADDSGELAQHIESERQKIETLRYRLYGDMADLPVQQVEAYVIGRLQELAWASGVDLVSVEPSHGERVEIFQETLFGIELVGHYEDLYLWLWKVRNELGYVVVEEYALSRSGGTDEAPFLQANLRLASYRAVR